MTNAFLERVTRYIIIKRCILRWWKHWMKISIIWSSLTFRCNAGVYIAENGCKWLSLPEKFAHWHTIYTRAKRWAERDVLERLCIGLKKEKLIKMSVTCLGLDSTSIKVHPDAGGGFKKNGPPSTCKSRGGLPTKIHMVSVNDRVGSRFCLWPGQAPMTLKKGFIYCNRGSMIGPKFLLS